MILIFGGAFQGKLDYAREHWNFNEDDIFYCDDSLAIDLSKKVIYGLEKFCFACVCEDADAKGVLKMYDEPLTDKIIIMDDVSQGVVPIDTSISPECSTCPVRQLWRMSSVLPM